MSTSYLSHNRSEVIGFHQLKALPQPEILGTRHKPVPHFEVMEVLKNELQNAGFNVEAEEYAIAKEGLRLFGTMDLTSMENNSLTSTERGLSIGFRHGNDQSMALKIIAGNKVFVCDNMMLSGDAVLTNRKHTTFINVQQLIRESVNFLQEKFENIQTKINELHNQTLRDTVAKAKIYDIFTQDKLLAMKYLPKVDAWYFNTPGEATDCQERSMYGLHNAFTRVLSHEVPSPMVSHHATQQLGTIFNI